MTVKQAIEDGLTPFPGWPYSREIRGQSDLIYIGIYNLPATHRNQRQKWDWVIEQPLEMPKKQRAGLLTHPAWLAAHSLNDGNDPVRRGQWIQEKLLAGVIQDVPPDVDANVPNDPHETLRERMEPLRADRCWRCHRKMNPLGEPFEVFDDWGRYRTEVYFDVQGEIVHYRGDMLEQFYKSPEDNYCYPFLSAMNKGQPVAYQASPRKAYMELFGSAVVSPEQLKRQVTLNTNLMDFMKEDARRIERQLSSDDKQRFANYTAAFESLRERAQKKVLLGDRVKQFAPELTSRYDSTVTSVRMELHFDLATSALITGLTNVVTLRPDTLGVIYSDLGINQSVHSLGHLGYGKAANGWDGPRARKEIDKLHLSFIAKMAKKLKSFPKATAPCWTTPPSSTCRALVDRITRGKRIGRSCWLAVCKIGSRWGGTFNTPATKSPATARSPTCT
jgi:hypothetical protein